MVRESVSPISGIGFAELTTFSTGVLDVDAAAVVTVADDARTSTRLIAA